MYTSTLVPLEEPALDKNAVALGAVCLPLIEIGPHEHTNSINRGYSDIDSMQFVAYAAGLCWLRTALQQPLNLALARQQTCSAANAMSSFEIVRRVYRCEGGLRGLTQGMAALTLGCALSEALYLWLFEYGRERLPLESEASRDAISGYSSDAACRLVHLPLSIVALRQMTLQKVVGGRLYAPKNIYRTMADMYSEGGLRTVYAGYGTTLVVGCQWTAMWWAMYGWSKAQLYHLFENVLVDSKNGDVENTLSSMSPWRQWLLAKDDNFVLNSVASVFTSSSTAVLFNPYLVIRSNLQVTPKARFWGVVRELYRTRGIRGFFGGLRLNVSTCLIDGVLASTSYEYAKLWADKSHYN